MFDGMHGGGFMWFGWILGMILFVVIIWVVITLINKIRKQ